MSIDPQEEIFLVSNTISLLLAEYSRMMPNPKLEIAGHVGLAVVSFIQLPSIHAIISFLRNLLLRF